MTKMFRFVLLRYITQARASWKAGGVAGRRPLHVLIYVKVTGILPYYVPLKWTRDVLNMWVTRVTVILSIRGQSWKDTVFFMWHSCYILWENIQIFTAFLQSRIFFLLSGFASCRVKQAAFISALQKEIGRNNMLLSSQIWPDSLYWKRNARC